MKPWHFLIASAVLVSSGLCFSQPAFQDPFTRPQIDWKPRLVLDVTEAERILGNKSHLEKVTAYMDEDARAYQSSFRDDQLDPATGKTGALGYRYEEYPSAEAARTYLDSTLKANRLDRGRPQGEPGDESLQSCRAPEGGRRAGEAAVMR